MLLAGAVPACLLFTDAINSAPKVMIVAPATLHPRDRAMFTAQASDPDGDTVTLEWFVAPKKCQAVTAAEWAELQPTSTEDVLYLDVAGHDPFCVRVVARDRQGATSAAQPYEVTPQNRPPAPTLTVDPPMGAASFPLYTTCWGAWAWLTLGVTVVGAILRLMMGL